ncbi:DUF1080 domain-containing protein [Planctomyces sp. SH-PL62]|uniref:3-keto-disaccharide hydrolase n=1 Tax=Planctomyces sp. SH-PL62 TaxID=1636152 RepID=UPI00078D8CDD|nr:DUF1080 domain-containing protein [Planctomyces sp. SH-PL62]AMV40675.1 hypothetical protein VT85_24805 [Planctomyces sp. SH-PL62]
MQKKLPLTLALLAASAAFAGRPAAADEPAFQNLFNGKDLSGWHGESTIDPRKFRAMSPEEQKAKLEKDAADAAQHWKVADGEIVNDGHGVFLATDKEYGDVEFFIDFKIGPMGDSGIYLRGTPQIQIWDFREEAGKHDLGAGKGSGGLWNNSPGAPGKDPLVFADNPIGEWNTLRVVQVGARTTIHLNGKLVVDGAIMENYWDRDLPLAAVGPIQLQTHGSETRFRNVKLREIPAAEANALLAKIDADGFTKLFDGKDLSGWKGAVDNYEVVDGAIRCKPGHGGVLYHENELGDFVARVEFKVPPGGNNGLAIRYPGSGDAAYNGMTELQILDDDADQYAKLDPRQYHGSVYGMVAAKRGYLRPVGEWNFEEVTVKGSKIKVELNGSVIVDADLSTVKEFMADSPHPGKDRTKGYFGFAGHNDPVEFRSVSIKSLD